MPLLRGIVLAVANCLAQNTKSHVRDSFCGMHGSLSSCVGIEIEVCLKLNCTFLWVATKVQRINQF